MRSAQPLSGGLSTKQNMLWNTIGCLLYQACIWAMTVVVVVFSPDYSNSGALAFAMAIGNLYYPLATYNMRTIQVSDVEDEYSPAQYVGLRIVTVIVGFLPILIYLLATASSEGMVLTALCWLLFKADESFCCVYYAVDQKAMRMDRIGISQAIRGVAGLLAFSVTLLFSGSVNLAILLVAGVCILVTVFFDLPSARAFADVRPSICISTAVAIMLKYLPAVITLVCYGAVVSVARQTYETMCGAEALGLYAAVATPTVLIQAAASYLYNPLLVSFAQDWAEGKVSKFSRRVAAVCASIAAVSIVGVVASELFGEHILVMVFGEHIRSSAYLLTPALLATAVTTLFAFSFDILMVVRSLRLALIANVVAVVVSAVSSPALITRFGGNGVTFAVIFAFGIGLVFCLGSLAWRVAGKKRSSIAGDL